MISYGITYVYECMIFLMINIRNKVVSFYCMRKLQYSAITDRSSHITPIKCVYNNHESDKMRAIYNYGC